jgi:hypothetical protein
MKKVSTFLVLLFFLVGCSSEVKEVNGLIEDEKYTEAVKLIEEYDLLNKERKQDEYNYQNIIILSELRGLFDEGEYNKLIKKYLDNPIKDDKLNGKIHKLLEDSFEGMVDKDYLSLARENFDKLDDELQKTLEGTNNLIKNAEKLKKEEDERKKAEIEKANEKRDIELLKLMEDKKYKEITMQTTSGNLYDLASAYISFENDENIYIYGIESMPEHYLNNIKNPPSEIQKYIDLLLKQIDDKKAGLASTQGVIIGMTKDAVLKSSWGKPQKINTTTNSYGTREQWVYGNRNYLYFENDILVSIQN